MKNKLLKTTIILSMFILVLIPISTSAATVNSSTCGNNLTWTLDDNGTLTISGTGDMADYYSSSPWDSVRSSIKSVIIKDNVTSIGRFAFAGCSNLTAVTIPDSIINIGDSAFYYCSSLTSITIPEDVISIGNAAFSGCSSLTSITIPNSVTSIGDSAFYSCSSLTSITIPNSVTSIGNSAFSGCSSLTSITIPNSVTSIGDSAFEGCSNLFTIAIPNSITSLGKWAFSDCSNLKNIYITDLESWCNIEFGNSTSSPLCNGANLYLNNELVEALIIPSSITTINNYTFYGCNSLLKVTIPDGITSIGNSAFSNCSNILSITIPNSITGIGDSAFSGCSSLLKSTIPDSVTTINNSVFSNCDSLTTVTIPDSVTSIGDSAFFNCNNLTTVTIPDSVTSIGNSAFSNCANLTTVTIPDNVTNIGTSAFLECDSLTAVTIPDSVTTLGNKAFCRCNSLTTIKIGNSVTSIGNEVFGYCSNLTAVTIPDSVTSISNSAFYNCSSLTSVTIGKGVTSIGKYAFHSCSRLKNVYITDLEAWCNIEFENSSSNPLYNSANLYLNDELVEGLIIPDSVKKIENYIFYNCQSLKYVTFPENMFYIKNDAFYGCSNIENVFVKDSEAKWNEVLIYSGNECLTNANIIFNAVLKTYKFQTNCDTALPDITTYCISSAPTVENGEKTITGWYDNEALSGDAITFPYYGNATTLYAAWTDNTGTTFEDAFTAKANMEYTITTTEAGQLIYYEFVPKLTGEYRFYSKGNLNTYGYLYNSNKSQLTYNNNDGEGYNFYISYNLTAGEKYYIAAKCYTGTGTFTLVTETDCIEGTKTVCITSVSGEKVFTCIPNYLPENSLIVLCCYKDGELTETQHTLNKNETINFVVDKDFASAKVMVWESFGNIKPLCNFEAVPLQ